MDKQTPEVAVWANHYRKARTLPERQAEMRQRQLILKTRSEYERVQMEVIREVRRRSGRQGAEVRWQRQHARDFQAQLEPLRTMEHKGDSTVPRSCY